MATITNSQIVNSGTDPPLPIPRVVVGLSAVQNIAVDIHSIFGAFGDEIEPTGIGCNVCQ